MSSNSSLKNCLATIRSSHSINTSGSSISASVWYAYWGPLKTLMPADGAKFPLNLGAVILHVLDIVFICPCIFLCVLEHFLEKRPHLKFLVLHRCLLLLLSVVESAVGWWRIGYSRPLCRYLAVAIAVSRGTSPVFRKSSCSFVYSGIGGQPPLFSQNFGDLGSRGSVAIPGSRTAVPPDNSCR